MAPTEASSPGASIPEPPVLRGPWTHREVTSYLADTVIPMRIGVETGSGWPLVLSVWFLPDGLELLAASRPTSTLVRCLLRRPECGFEVAGDTPPYHGVRGRARVELDPVGGAGTLDGLLERYLGGVDSPLAERLRADAADEVGFRLRPVSLTSWDYRDRMASSLPDGPGR